MIAAHSPYPPSWFDRAIAGATRRQPGWWPVVGMLLALGFLLAGGGAALAGGTPAEIAFWSLNSVYGVYALVAYRHLMDRTGRAFDRFQPLLPVGDEEAGAIRSALTTLPGGVASWSLVAGLAVGAAAALSDVNLPRLAARSMTGAALIGANIMFSVGVAFVLLAQIIRILRLVTALHRSARTPDLFAPDPAHAFSTVTAPSSSMIILAHVYSMLTDPTTLTKPVWIGTGAVAMAVSVTVFFYPLLDMGRRLRRQKHALLAGTTLRTRRVIGEIALAAA